jgi:hypothetical protein
VHDCTGKKKNRIAIQSIQRYAKLPPLPIIPILSKSDFMLQHAATKVLRWYQLYQLYQLFKSQAFLCHIDGLLTSSSWKQKQDAI